MKALLLLCIALSALATLAWGALSYQPFAPLPPPEAAATLQARPHTQAKVITSPNPADPRLLPYAVEAHPTPPLGSTLNILVAGFDSRAPRGLRGRSDALMVVVFDQKSHHVGWVSLHRDFLVNLPGDDFVRLNAVFRWGAKRGGAEAGARQLKASVERLLGLPIAHLAFVDHAGFERIVDAMGGVHVEVLCPLRDRFIDERAAGGRMLLDVPAGHQPMDGRTALMFARSRHGRSVVDRNRRQQAVAMGLLRKLQRQSPTALRVLLHRLEEAVYTDISAGRLLSLGLRLARTERRHLHGLVLGAKHGTPTTLDDGRWVMLPDTKRIAAGLAALFAQESPGHRDMRRSCPPVDAALRRPLKGKRGGGRSRR